MTLADSLKRSARSHIDRRNRALVSAVQIEAGGTKAWPLTPPGILFHGAALTAGVGRYSRVGGADGSEWTESGVRPGAGPEAGAPG